jgi:hypothetical protein
MAHSERRPNLLQREVNSEYRANSLKSYKPLMTNPDWGMPFHGTTGCLLQSEDSPALVIIGPRQLSIQPFVSVRESQFSALSFSPTNHQSWPISQSWRPLSPTCCGQFLPGQRLCSRIPASGSIGFSRIRMTSSAFRLRKVCSWLPSSLTRGSIEVLSKQPRPPCLRIDRRAPWSKRCQTSP